MKSPLNAMKSPWSPPFIPEKARTLALGALPHATFGLNLWGLDLMDKDLGAREASETTRKYGGNSAAVNIFHPKMFGDNVNPGLINHGLLIRGVLLQ